MFFNVKSPLKNNLSIFEFSNCIIKILYFVVELLNSNYTNLSKYAVLEHVNHYRISYKLTVQNKKSINIYVFGSDSDTSHIYGIFASTRTDNLSSGIYTLYDNMSEYGNSAITATGWDITFTSNFGFYVDHYVLARL